jgi:mitochondrial import inner membrane translocase subunit TIM13
MHKMRADYANVAAQEMFQKITDRCFDLCVSRPGKKLDAVELNCLSRCHDRYADTMNVVAMTIAARSERVIPSI